ncbi:MAG: hypothetical protein ACYTEQ_08275 [Planctomycetota bacterium]|jgi:hypothetical protein
MEESVDKFLRMYRPILVRAAEHYLANETSHKQVRDCAWEIIDAWSTLGNTSKEGPYLEGERGFWATIWALIHHANEEHWNAGVAQQELPGLLEILKCRADLPAGYDAKRP